MKSEIAWGPVFQDLLPGMIDRVMNGMDYLVEKAVFGEVHEKYETVSYLEKILEARCIWKEG
jgi:hypothetical protein